MGLMAFLDHKNGGIVSTEGTIQSIGIYTNQEEDSDFFKEGHITSIVYALDELKPEAMLNFGQKYNQIALEMAVSLEPVK